MIAYCDGGYRNDGKSVSNNTGYGSFLVTEETDPEHYITWQDFNLPQANTNNEAEYWSLIYLLNYLKSMSFDNVTIYSDSQLLVNHVNGNWNINYAHLMVLWNMVKSFKLHFKIEWKPRKEIFDILGH